MSSVIFNDHQPPPDDIPDLVADDSTLKEQGPPLAEIKTTQSRCLVRRLYQKIDPWALL